MVCKRPAPASTPQGSGWHVAVCAAACLGTATACGGSMHADHSPCSAGISVRVALSCRRRTSDAPFGNSKSACRMLMTRPTASMARCAEMHCLACSSAQRALHCQGTSPCDSSIVATAAGRPRHCSCCAGLLCVLAVCSCQPAAGCAAADVWGDGAPGAAAGDTG